MKCWLLQPVDSILQWLVPVIKWRCGYAALRFLLPQGNHGVLGVRGLSCSPSPVHVPGLWEVGVLQIAAGEAHCAALGANDFAYTWGRGKYGQLGHGGFEDEEEPRQVRAKLAAWATYLTRCLLWRMPHGQTMESIFHSSI